jgi:hypothetical protein
MGGSMSTSGIRERIRNKTKGDGDILNLIFEFMLKQATLADFYSVADPSRCKNYVLAGKEALLKLFITLQIQPVRDAKNSGLLYFQRIDGLKEGLPAELRNKQNEYCLELSFFFIRIFQIFGALTLSVMDVTMPNDIGDVLTKQRGPIGQAYLGAIPGFGVQKGGVLTGQYNIPSDNNYSILNKYLSNPKPESPNQLIFKDYTNMYIDTGSMYAGAVLALRTPDFKPRVVYNYMNEVNNTEQISGILTIIKEGNKIKLTINELKRNNTPNDRTVQSELIQNYAGGDFLKNNRELNSVIFEIMKSIAPPPAFSVVKFFKDLRYIADTIGDEQEKPVRNTNITILPNQPKTPVQIRYREEVRIKRDDGQERKTIIIIDGCTLNIEPLTQSTGLMLEFKVRVGMENRTVTPTNLTSTFEFKQYKESTFKRTNDGYEPTNDKGQTIPVYVQGVFKNIIERRDDAEGRGPKFSRTKEGYIIPHDSDNIPNESLRVKKLWDALTSDPPVKAFCVARAMQLLSPAALEGALPSEALTSICRTTFPYQSNGSIGKVGQSIDKIHGVRAMASLFIDTIQNGVPKVTEAAKYKDFLRGFKTMFERVQDVPPAGPSSLGEITERPPGFCPPGDNRGIINDRSVISTLRSKVLEMINRQITHTGNVMKVISKLFTVEGSGQVLFNVSVKTKGIPYIDSVAAEARELLLKYYSDCEAKYTEGLHTLSAARATTRFTSVGATAVPRTSPV